MTNWDNALNISTLRSHCLVNSLGNWVAALPRIWRVFYDKDNNCMETMSDTEGIIKYEFQSTRRFTRVETTVNATPKGALATASELSPEMLRLLCTSKAQYTGNEEEYKLVLEFLHSWGGEWMWSDLRLTKSPEWIVECLKKKTLVCVTDGSYNKKKAPGDCSAG